jgi:hypothetical protein
VVHPTAATPLLYNRFAPPFVFLVTDIPEAFRKYLVNAAIIEVTSPLGTLFIENGDPIPHDYVTTLTNYNLRTDSELLRTRATDRVRQSATNLLFDTPSDTSRRIAAFIRMYRDNIPEDLSDDEARDFIRESVKVETLEIIVPGTKVPTSVYNVYIHPPTASKDRLDRWRQWVTTQKFYADIYGVGVKYQFQFRCNHCKTIDHPSGLCPHEEARKRTTGERNDDPNDDEDDDELLPLKREPGQPPARPKPPTPGPGPDKQGDRKGKGRATEPPAPGKGQKGPTRTRPNETKEATKKRKLA